MIFYYCKLYFLYSIFPILEKYPLTGFEFLKKNAKRSCEYCIPNLWRYYANNSLMDKICSRDLINYLPTAKLAFQELRITEITKKNNKKTKKHKKKLKILKMLI